MKQTCVLILGMHRSGTSALSGLLHNLGIDLGSKLVNPKVDNPKGFFENYFIVDFNETILNKLESSWDDIFFDYESKKESIDDYDLERLKNIFLQEFSNSSCFAIKDPRICYLFPMYEKVLNELEIEVKVLIPCRNPIEVAQSLEKRDGFSFEKSTALWLNYFLKAELYSRNYKRFFLKFDDLILKTEDTLKEFSTQLDTTFLYEKYLINKTIIEKFLDAGLKNNNVNEICSDKNLNCILKDFLVLYSKNLNKLDINKFDSIRNKNNEHKMFYSKCVSKDISVLNNNIEKYKSKNQLLKICMLLKQYKVVFFGASGALEKSWGYLELNSILPDYICDNDTSRHENKFRDYEVLSPDNLFSRNELFIVCITSTYENEIREQLYKYKNILQICTIKELTEYESIKEKYLNEFDRDYE